MNPGQIKTERDSKDPLLSVEDLHVTFYGDGGREVRAVSGLSLALQGGKILGIVGESGSGKSVTALSIMRLLPKGSADIRGSIRFEGRDLLSLPDSELRQLRGNRIAMIFQEPMTSLNPSYTIGDQVGEALVRHRGLKAAEARREAVRLLERVRIPAAGSRIDDYPHHMSGGMRQRVMIAMALACQPSILIADEPTTALDVTIQAQILDLLNELCREMGTAILLITHDLGVVAEMCDDVVVMYAGQAVEQAPVGDLLSAPEHPYTVGLMGSIPRLGTRRERLATIAGTVPSLDGAFRGCRFADRCPFAQPGCRDSDPPLVHVHGGRATRCIRAPLANLVA